METDHPPVTSDNDMATKTVTREAIESPDQVTIEEESTVLEMHIDMETGASNNTIGRSVRTGVITRTASTEDSAMEKSDSDDDDVDVTLSGSCHYPETPTSPQRSIEVGRPTVEGRTVNQREPVQSPWKLGNHTILTIVSG